MPEWVNFALAALSGSVLTEVVRRTLPNKDKVLELQLKREAESDELQLKREAETAKVEGDLRKALWDEIDRLTRKIGLLETKLEQSTQAIHALKAQNHIQQAEIQLLSKKLGLEFKPLPEDS